MNGRARTLAVALGVLALCGLLWWRLAPREPAEGTAPAPQSELPGSPTPQDTAAAPVHRPTASGSQATPAPSSPRPTPAPAASPGRIVLAPPEAVPHDSDYTVPPPQTQLRDRRANPGPHAASEREAVGYALDTLDEDIEACLDEWRKTQTKLQGSLMLSIEIDASGLQKAWIDTDGGVPLGPQSCFANAVYGIDWSHMAHQPAMITRPYSFEKEDGGS
jgi:hypothetical protein